VRVDRVDTDVFEATLQGSATSSSIRCAPTRWRVDRRHGDVRLKGTATSLGAVIEGSGDLHAAELPANQVAVRMRGSGDARVHAIDELKVEVDGSATCTTAARRRSARRSAARDR